ncbi:MAG: hypothetical protein M1813_009715 [Trichoglossum hirsutum]|jgi:hypothetical protein|nr:MAG: hypothetical protein M1813_009715 [Trichoglossum hirsutum]
MGVWTAVLLILNYPSPLTTTKLWMFRLRVDGNERWIDRWVPKVIWTSSDDPLPEPDLLLELSIEDAIGEYIGTLPLDDLHWSITFSIPFGDLRSWCTSILNLYLV